jgi:hypothetical protein
MSQLPTDENRPTLELDQGFAEIHRLRGSYTKFLVGIKRITVVSGRLQFQQLIGNLEMTPEAVLNIEESTRRWAGGGGFMATVSDTNNAQLVRFKYDVAGAPSVYQGPGTASYKDAGLDPGVTHLLDKQVRKALEERQQQQQPGDRSYELLQDQLKENQRRNNEDAVKRERELAELRRRLDQTEERNRDLLEKSLREGAEAKAQALERELQTMREDMRRERERPPARSPIDWLGVATALAAPAATVLTAIVSAGTSKHERLLMSIQAAQAPKPPETRQTLLAEIKELMSIPGADKILGLVLGKNNATADDRANLMEALAEQNLAYMSMFRDVMEELGPKGDPTAVTVTKMISDGIGRIAGVIEQATGRRAEQQQQQPQQTQLARQEHVAEVVQQGGAPQQQQPQQQEQDPGISELQGAFDKLPATMKTREWATVLEHAHGIDRGVIHSEEIDMLAELVVELLNHATRFGTVPAELQNPDEPTLKQLCAWLIPFSEDHQQALYHALTRVLNKTEPIPSIVTPRPQERVGGPDGNVVPFQR